MEVSWLRRARSKSSSLETWLSCSFGGAREIASGLLGGGAGLGETGLEGREFGGPLALAEIGEAGLGLARPLDRFAQFREFGALLKGEQGRAGGDEGALLHGEFVETTRRGVSEIDEFAFEVTLVGGGSVPGAAGEGEGRRVRAGRA